MDVEIGLNAFRNSDKGMKLHNICTEQNYKRNTFAFAPIFQELNSKI